MANIGNLVATIGADVSKLQNDLQKADRMFKSFANRTANHLKRVKSAVFSLQGAFITLAGGYGLKRLMSSFLDTARTMENYQVRLKVLLGSTEKGNKLFKDMRDYASKVPFTFQDIMGAATQLAGIMGGSVDRINQWIPLIGDLAAATGLSIQKTTEQVSRMYSAGAASADLFRERGVLAMLGFQAGVSYSAEETRKKLIEAWTKSDSSFRGATKEMAKTWDGLMSMMEDAWTDLRDMIMKAGIYDALKQALSDVNEGLRMWIANNKELIQQKIPVWVERFKQELKDIKSLLIGIYELYQIISLPADKLINFTRDLGKALGMATGGLFSFSQVAEAVAKGQLAELVKRGEELLSIYDKINKGRPVIDVFNRTPRGPIEGLSRDTLTLKEKTELLNRALLISEDILRARDLAMEEAAIPIGEIIAGTKEYQELLRRGMLISDDYIRAHHIGLELAAQSVDDMSDKIKRLSDTFSRAFVDMLWEGEFTFKRLGESLVKDFLSKLMSEQMQSLFTSVTNTGGMFGGFFRTLASIFHGGGIVGMGSPSRMVPAAAFIGAPRLHSGLAADEYPAILQRGEVVLPRITGRTAYGPSIQITNNNDFRGADPTSEMRMISAMEIRDEQTKQDILESLERGGLFATAIRRIS